MNHKYKMLFKNMFYLTVSNFASRILVFLLVPLYTSVLSTEEYGGYDAIVTTIQILVPIVTLNITDGLMRFLLDNTNDRNKIINIGYKYTAIGIISMAMLFTANRFVFHISFLQGYEIYAFLYALVYMLNNFFIQYAKGINKVSVMATAGVMGTILMIGFNLIFLIVLKKGIIGFFFANILSLGIPVIYYFIKLCAYIDIRGEFISKPTQKDMLKYSVPLIFNTIGWTINSSLDKYCIIFFYGVAASGILAVAYKIPTILSTLYGIFTQAWQISAVSEYDSEGRNKFYSDSFNLMNTVGALCCAGLLVGNRLLARILFQNEFYEAWKYVPFLLLSAMFNQTAGFMGSLISAKKKSNAVAIAAIWGIVSNFVFNIVFILFFGIQGAAIATAISSFVIYFVRWWYARDLINHNVYKCAYLTWALLLVGCVAEVFGIHYYIQVTIVFLIAMVNRKQIFKVVKILIRRIKNESNRYLA